MSKTEWQQMCLSLLYNVNRNQCVYVFIYSVTSKSKKATQIWLTTKVLPTNIILLLEINHLIDWFCNYQHIEYGNQNKITRLKQNTASNCIGNLVTTGELDRTSSICLIFSSILPSKILRSYPLGSPCALWNPPYTQVVHGLCQLDYVL